MDASKLHVITPYTNPLRFASRRNLYEKYKRNILNAGVQLYTIEVTFGDRTPELVQSTHPNDHVFYAQTWEEIWHKEAMINIVANHKLPSNWEFMAWIDGDVVFENSNWAEETVQCLQHHMWAQLFQTAVDLGPRHQVLHVHQGFVWSYLSQQPYKGKAYSGWHPGYAWAARREAFDGVGGLLDIGIAGAGDHHMALGLISRAKESYPEKISQSYKEHVLAWESRAEDIIRYDIGYVSGSLMHYWHGKKKDRKYWERWQILIKNDFNPNLDLVREPSGLYRLSNLKPDLRDDLRVYFRQRNEDSIDLE